MEQGIVTILSQKEIASNIFKMVLKGKLLETISQPGQFLHIKAMRETMLLRRPISITSYNKTKQEATIIYRPKGQGTTDFTQLKKGETLDVIGPLGNGFDLSAIKKGQVVYFIGGGIGIPPLYEAAKQAKEKGAIVKMFFGFASKEVIFYEKEFQALGEVFIATDDGSYGHKGLVLDILPKKTPDAVYACGPNGLLRALDVTYHNHPNAFLSLEARMACGIGACYACVVSLQKEPNKSKKVCDQGPVFHTGEVIL